MINFENICRTCLSEGELHSLFIKDIFIVADMLNQIVDIKINKDDHYPQNICINCLEKLKSAYYFIKQCHDVDHKLKDYLNTQNPIVCKIDVTETLIKEEETTEEVDLDPCEFYIDKASFVDDIDEKKPLDTEKGNNLHKECSICLKNIRKKTYKRHIRSHIRQRVVKLIECSVCSKRLYKRNYARHMKIHTGERPYLCTFCGQDFIQKVGLQSHIRLHTGEKPYNCTYCEKSYTQRGLLLYHMKVQHTDKIKPSATGKFQCKICYEKFGSKKLLSTHKLLHNERSFRFLCNHCGKVFNTAALLKQHIIIHTSERPFECDLCDKSFKRHSDLLQHKKKHYGEKQYTCTVCEKQFWTKVLLGKHILIHTGEKPHKCEICNQTFRQKTHLKYHSYTHTGEKPFKCTLCDKQFALKSNLTAHVRTHTGETPYICKICNKGFHASYNLKKHKRIHLSGV